MDNEAIKYQKENNISMLTIIGTMYNQHKLDRAYVITGNADDFGPISISDSFSAMKIPAWLACYWLSQSEQRV